METGFGRARNDHSDTELAVKMTNAYKSYGKFNVLDSLNMNVPLGSIYGLLGPSGCGKTTILRSIAGRLNLDSGEIKVLDEDPSRRGSSAKDCVIGYMPQDIALNRDFYISEILNYFGMLYSMSKSQIVARNAFLINLLDIPKKDKLIKNLSGGQKRRVSLAVALIQQPELLILDEPTVGVDPLLREKIWKHLIEISKISNTTIIITTHYIEEARKADFVGLMRNGKILAEQNPQHLLDTHNETNLENVFLKLCIEESDTVPENKKESKKRTNKEISNGGGICGDGCGVGSDDGAGGKGGSDKLLTENVPKKPTNISRNIRRKFEKSFDLPRYNHCKALVYKNLITMRRSFAAIFFDIYIPIMQVILFYLCIGRNPHGINFGIVNNETAPASEPYGSKLFIDQMCNKTFQLHAMNWSDAYRETKAGNIWGFISFNKNFTQDTLAKTNLFSLSEDTTHSGSNIDLYIDASNQQMRFIILSKLLEAYQGFMKKLIPYMPIGVSSSILDLPFIVSPVFGSMELEFVNYVLPGFTLSIIFIIAMALTSLTFVSERKEGLLDRSLVAGVNVIELMLSHTIVKLGILIVQAFVILFIILLMLQIKVNALYLLASLIFLLQGLCGISFGFAISTLAREESEALLFTVGLVLPLLIVSGILWPLEGMPDWFQYPALFSPLTYSAEAIRSVFSRGFGFHSITTWYGILIVILWSLLFNLIALICFNFDS